MSKIQSYIQETIREMELEELHQFNSAKHISKVDRDEALRDHIIDNFFEYNPISGIAHNLLVDSFWCASWCAAGDLVDLLLSEIESDDDDLTDWDTDTESHNPEDLESVANFKPNGNFNPQQQK